MTNSRQHSLNREAMAQRLAAVLLAFPQTDAATVRALPAAGRRFVEELSGERRPASDETWTRVAAIIEREQSRRAEWVLRIIDNEAWLPPVVAA